jgi:hypothetical protein
MTTIAATSPSPNKAFLVVLVLLSVFFFGILGVTSYLISTRQIAEVPLKPCRRCTAGCPCPRLSGSIRCGCPD